MSPDTKAPKSGMFLEGSGQNSEVLLGLNVVQSGQELVRTCSKSFVTVSSFSLVSFDLRPSCGNKFRRQQIKLRRTKDPTSRQLRVDSFRN